MDRKEQISAMLDGELDLVPFKTLLSSMSDAELQVWKDHCMVGDLLRSSEMFSMTSPGLLARIEQRLDKEPVVIAPRVANALVDYASSQSLLKQSMLFGGRLFAFISAVAVISLTLHQMIPASEAQVQMVRTQALAGTLTEKELSLWQEYFSAHQQNSVRSGFSGVSSIARLDIPNRRPMLYPSQTVIADNMEPTEWMNVWGPVEHGVDQAVLFSYVSSPSR